MKKFMTIVLAATLSLSMLAGCTVNAASNTGAENRLEAIKERGYLEVATEPYFAPNEFIDASKPAGEQVIGSDIELARRIAERLGVELKIVPLEFSAVLSSVTTGKYDMAISALAYMPSRAEAMELSKAYYINPNSEGYSLMVREEDADQYKAFSDFDGKKIVCQSGSLQELYATTQMDTSKLADIARVSATTDGYLMVSEKKVDAAVCAVANAKLYCEANPGLTVLTDLRFQEDEEFSGTRVGIPKGETELLDLVNSVIDEVVESGEYLQWYTEYQEYAAKLGV
ncbi:MAG: transporter substrate-binding domain-containing protein [Oscillospiraceae bacterium]|jgi:polar amino acid transport system substrate-binding protein|nr:transporter substrate-binding domain-containing protein [Oscillospiraceae bacterium]